MRARSRARARVREMHVGVAQHVQNPDSGSPRFLSSISGWKRFRVYGPVLSSLPLRPFHVSCLDSLEESLGIGTASGDSTGRKETLSNGNSSLKIRTSKVHNIFIQQLHSYFVGAPLSY